ncbi:MAG: Jag N-terminal domain-containing protein [Candidatus Krumholzibacteriia bacterium]
MSNVMKSTAKTVDEAVREALLRMGLRREEVSVTVLQEARAGFLGMGRRDAVVEVARKSETERDARRRGTSRRDSGRRGRDGESGERTEARQGRGGERRGAKRDETDESKRSRRGGRGRSRDRNRDEENQVAQAAQATPEAATKVAEPRAERTERRDDESTDSNGRRRRRRPRRRRKSGATVDENGQQLNNGQDAQDDQDFQDDARPEERNAARDEAAQASPRRERPSPSPEVELNDDALPEVLLEGVEEDPRAVVAEAVEASSQVVEDEEIEASPAPQAPRSTGGAELVNDLVATHRVQPFGADDATDEARLLTRAATSLMVKAGFQARVTVTPGDYHQVKMVVDDRSAGVLIGRQGSTVDAVEHLVERIATRTVGERVKLNLDINNYRLRREDGLLGQTRAAMHEARESGEPVPMEPAGGRERRIVHLEVAEDDELVTYTEQGERGKYVVICRPEQVPAEYRNREANAGDEAEGSEESRDDA